MERHPPRLLPWAVMLVLESQSGRLPIRDVIDALSDELDFEDAQLYRTVETLRLSGYLDKHTHPDSGRERMIELTPRGTRACEVLARIALRQGRVTDIDSRGCSVQGSISS